MNPKEERSISPTQFFITILWPFKWYLIGQMAVHVIWAVDISLKAYLVKKMIDVVTNCTDTTVLMSTVSWYAVIYLLVLCAVSLSYRFYDWMYLTATPAIEQKATLYVFSRLIKQSHSFYQDQFAGKLANNVRIVSDRIPDLIDLLGEKIFSHLLAILIAALIFWQAGGWFAIALLIWVTLFVGVAFYSLPRLCALSDTSSEYKARTVGQAVDTFTNMLSVRLFTGQKFEQGRMGTLTNHLVQAERARCWFYLKMHVIQSFLFIAFIAFCLWLLIVRFKSGLVTAGDFALILTTTGYIINFMWGISQDLVKFSHKFGSVIQGLRAALSALNMVDVPGASHLIVHQGKITFDRVCFRYHGPDNFFHNLSVTINPGQKVGLVGYSGGGKSTFVNLILRLFDIASGQISIDGQNIAAVAQESLHRAIGFIPQDPVLFHRTIYENILYARPGASEKEIAAAALRAHAHEFIMESTNGYQTEVGERGTKLSGGQRQRISIARAILKDAPILIVDEGTSQLDSITERYIQESLDTLMQGKTTLVIAHRLSTLLHMDRILVFDQGKIVQDGTHEQLLEQDGLYKTLWEHQVGGFLQDEDDDDASEVGSMLIKV